MAIIQKPGKRFECIIPNKVKKVYLSVFIDIPENEVITD
jgi:hypothetical protein